LNIILFLARIFSSLCHSGLACPERSRRDPESILSWPSCTSWLIVPFGNKNMQNKPNLREAQMNITAFIVKNYEEIRPPTPRKNKPNSNPNKPNSKPITKRPKMNVTKVSTNGYGNSHLPARTQNKPNTNPNKGLTISKPHLLIALGET